MSSQYSIYSVLPVAHFFSDGSQLKGKQPEWSILKQSTQNYENIVKKFNKNACKIRTCRQKVSKS